MKEDASGLVAICQLCHSPFEVGITGEAYTCFACSDALAEEPAKVAWEDVTDD